MKLVSINPYTEEINGEFETFHLRPLRRGRQSCQVCPSLAWQRFSVAERVHFLKRIIAQLEKRKPFCGQIITQRWESPSGRPFPKSISVFGSAITTCSIPTTSYKMTSLPRKRRKAT